MSRRKGIAAIGAFMFSSVGHVELARSPVHVVSDPVTMGQWLGQVVQTRDFPPDLPQTLRAHGANFTIEMSTAPGCVPCGDLWAKLWAVGQGQGQGQGWRIGTISEREAMIRSGRMGLPWVGHPVAWVRSQHDPGRMVPIAIGTDHVSNLRRNIYLAVKMMTGVRPAVGVRAMARFTGIVGEAASSTPQIAGPDRRPGPERGPKDLQRHPHSSIDRASGKAGRAARPLSSFRSPPCPFRPSEIVRACPDRRC